MFEIISAITLLMLSIIVLIKYKSFWHKQHESVAKYFNGKISSDGNSVTIHYKNKEFIVSRMSGANYGSYGALILKVQESINFTISKNYLNKIEITASNELKEKLVKLFNENKNLEEQIKKSLSKNYSTIQGDSNIHISRKKIFKKVQTIGLYGLSNMYLQEPRTLEIEMDNLLQINKILNENFDIKNKENNV